MGLGRFYTNSTIPVTDSTTLMARVAIFAHRHISPSSLVAPPSLDAAPSSLGAARRTRISRWHSGTRSPVQN
jgi:hypothetical protein